MTFGQSVLFIHVNAYSFPKIAPSSDLSSYPGIFFLLFYVEDVSLKMKRSKETLFVVILTALFCSTRDNSRYGFIIVAR